MAPSTSITLTKAVADRRHEIAVSTLSDNDVALLTAPIATIAEQMDLVFGSHEAKLDTDTVRDLIDRLAVYSVTYLWGGSADAGLSSPYHRPEDAPINALIYDLARVPNARLRDALIAVLLRHPEHALAVRTVFSEMQPDDPARRLLVARLLAAVALQQMGGTALTLDDSVPPQIDITDLVERLGLPYPYDQGGEALLREAAGLLAGPAPIDWIDAWKDVLQHVLREVHWARHPVGAK